MLKKRVVAAVAAALLAGSASAVTVNPEGTGDFLIAPAYFIGGGLKTHLQIINTDATRSTVAKLVFRDRASSAELLDFLVYLSPNDVWNGTIQCNASDAAGNCTSSSVVSNDDSSEVGHSTADYAFSVTNDAASGRAPFSNEGYIDIEMGPAFTLAPDQAPLFGVKKTSIIKAYEDRKSGAVAPGRAVGPAETPNILTGSTKVEIPGFGAATIPMVALADFNTAVLPVVAEPSGLESPSALVADVEEALWKNNLAVPYKITSGGFSLVTFTFPTKLSFDDTRNGQYVFAERALPRTAATPHTTVCFNGQVYDTKEQTRALQNISPRPTADLCAFEFDFKLFGPHLTTGTFTEGWARITAKTPQVAVGQTVIADNRNTGRSGVPMISTYMIRSANGDLSWAYTPSTR